MRRGSKIYGFAVINTKIECYIGKIYQANNFKAFLKSGRSCLIFTIIKERLITFNLQMNMISKKIPKV